MPRTESKKGILEQVLQDHRELREIVIKLREFCGRPRPEVDAREAPAWASELAQRLVKFHDRVYRHFDEEEGSGFLDSISQTFPHASRSVDALKEQHQSLLADLRSLINAAIVYAENRTPDGPRLRQRTHRLLDEFEQHEHAETELAQKLITEDLGCGD